MKKITLGIIIGLAIILIYIVLREGCLDGRGTDSYFDKSELQRFPSIQQFSLAQVSVIAQKQESCALVIYHVNKAGILKRVRAQEFTSAVNTYNKQCDNCLIVYRQGYPYKGELFHVTSKKPLCEQPTGRHWEDCINVKDVFAYKPPNENH